LNFHKPYTVGTCWEFCC